MNNGIWLIESPVQMVEGEVIAYSVDWLGASKVETPDVIVYKNGQDVTSTVMVSGDSHVVSGNVVTLKKITAQNNDGGNQYVVVVECGVDNNIERRKFLVQVVGGSAET
ncbi:MAG: hypothetical protein HON98_02575 [Chloroflexi bacterium]|jgi:hypothetical protein|nr:hypothetical protein [Chloroflexota bacterium]MBT3668727.1 hypothetical protein [Chloroflexota bacterium]MBT4002782.1 hypothetical protein [Chloroflexota bacterium]MBT4305428.1 hypothetical protein [Chloroflexota bacterium]MBT4533039.1 hypothetical protein [Chloroflexota bacterium]